MKVICAAGRALPPISWNAAPRICTSPPKTTSSSATSTRSFRNPCSGARPYHYEFFRTIRQEVIRATDEVVLAARGLAPLRAATLRRFRDRELNLDEFSVRWDLSRKARQRLVEMRQNKFIKASHRECQNRRSVMGRLGDAWSEQWWEIYNRLIYDFYHRNRRTFSNLLEEIGSEWEMLKLRAMKPWNKLRHGKVEEPAGNTEELTTLSEWRKTTIPDGPGSAPRPRKIVRCRVRIRRSAAAWTCGLPISTTNTRSCARRADITSPWNTSG